MSKIVRLSKSAADLEEEAEPEPDLDHLLLVERGQVAIVEPDDSDRGSEQPDHQLEHDRLAATAFADDAEGLPAFDLQVDVAEDHLLAEPHGHAVQIDDRPAFAFGSVEGRGLSRRAGHRRPAVSGQMA